MTFESQQQFVHLHVHTHYSRLSSTCRINKLVSRAKALGMSALAITDKACLFGISEFFVRCRAEGLKPIVGMEAYVKDGKNFRSESKKRTHSVILLAENLQGYQNLMKLSSIGFLKGNQKKPSISMEALSQHSAGLIATSAGSDSEIYSAAVKGDLKSTRKAAEVYLKLFGEDRFFIELQNQGTPGQRVVNPQLVELASKFGCGIVAANDVHFVEKEDHFSFAVFRSIPQGHFNRNQPNHLKEMYLKSPLEMAEAFAEWPDALKNSVHIADRCDVDVRSVRGRLPLLAESGSDEGKRLRQLCREGLQWRYGEGKVQPAILNRLDNELETIVMNKWTPYFLILADLSKYARENGIPIRAAGAGAGTFVGYLLGLSGTDPIRFGLLFERWTLAMKSHPYINFFVCGAGRVKLIEYLRRKYGHIAGIVCIAEMRKNDAYRETARVMGLCPMKFNRLAKRLSPLPDESVERNPVTQKVIDTAERLTGLNQNFVTHAAGVVVSDQPLEQTVPLWRDSYGQTVTQFEAVFVDELNLLHLNFLGLRELTNLQRCAVSSAAGKIDIDRIDFADSRVFRLFQQGKTSDVFQCESSLLRRMHQKAKPTRMEDLIALLALVPPCPSELFPIYLARRERKMRVPKIHPIVDGILADTYGLILFQEQSMRILHETGGLQLSDSWQLLKQMVMGKMKTDSPLKAQFLRGCSTKGITDKVAEKILTQIDESSRYGVCKAWLTQLAVLSYQMAYMKVHHPTEFNATLSRAEQ